MKLSSSFINLMHSFCHLHLLTFFKIYFVRKSFRNTIRMSNGLDSDQDQHSVYPDLGPNCFVKDISK